MSDDTATLSYESVTMCRHLGTEAQPPNAAAVSLAAKHAQGKKIATQIYAYHTESMAPTNKTPPPRSSGFLSPVTLYISQDIEIAIPGSTCRRAFTTVWSMP